MTDEMEQEAIDEMEQEAIDDLLEAYETIERIRRENIHLRQQVEEVKEIVSEPPYFPNIEPKSESNAHLFGEETSNRVDDKELFEGTTDEDSSKSNEEELDELKEKISDVRAEVDDVQAEVDNMQAEVDNMQAEVDDIQDDIGEFKNNIPQIEQELESFSSEMENRISKNIAKRISGPMVLGVGLLTLALGLLELIDFSFRAFPLIGIGLFALFTWRHMSRKYDLQLVNVI